MCGIDKLTNRGRSILFSICKVEFAQGSQLRVEYRFVHLCSNMCPVSITSPPKQNFLSKLESNQVDFVTGWFRHEYDGKMGIGPLVMLS